MAWHWLTLYSGTIGLVLIIETFKETFMKYSILLLAMLLSACEYEGEPYLQKSEDMSKITGLEGCSRIVVMVTDRSTYTKEIVYRCPNSTTVTTYNCGKSCTANNVVVNNTMSEACITEEKSNQMCEERIRNAFNLNKSK